jgi:5-hydroxyisourate hydrolase-like protein (transthyretin family)
MTGDNRVRFCDHCRLSVYNISELSRSEAEKLLTSSEGRLCTRLFRRADGTILTKDCPVGLRALRMRVSKRAAAVFAVIASISAAVFGQQSAIKDEKSACTPQTKITRVPSEHATNVLSGTVLDPNGAPVVNAKVTVTRVETNEAKTTNTNDAGRFEFALLTPGDYSIAIEALGFQNLAVTNLSIEAQQIVNLESIIEITGVHSMGISSIQPSPRVDMPPPGVTIISGDLLRRLPINK